MLSKLPDIFRKTDLLLFLSSFLIYFFYFHEILLHLNSILSGINADAIKNYFTYVFHIKNDPVLLHFNGLNFPYGEHAVYTDCQPLLTFILHYLPFTHNYLIGILHGLIFFSFIATPLLINRILIIQNIDRFCAFFISLAINLLSPQYYKILAGHYALAYTFVIPLCFLLLLRVFRERKASNLLLIFLFNLALFFIHPYFGLGTSLFCFISLTVFDLLSLPKGKLFNRSLQIAGTCILPIILFKFFMLVTDHHSERATEPQNVDALGADFGSLLLPNFGPLRDILPKIIKVPQRSSFEGFSYIGIFLILLTAASIIFLILARKKIVLQRDTLSIFISSLVLLLLAFGLHNTLLRYLDIRIAALDQFRACGRFIWFFYYTLPLFLIPLLYHSLKNTFNTRRLTILLNILSVFYFSFNLWEANSLFRLDREAFWKFRNIFNENYLSPNEMALIHAIKKTHIQAIIPLPLYHVGSEVYQRMESEIMYLSMIYAYHCNLPVISSFLSRTAISETEEVIQVLNCYKKQHGIDKFLNGGDFLLLKSIVPLAADEERLYSKSALLMRDSVIEAALLKEKDLFRRVTDTKQVFIAPGAKETDDIVSIIKEERKPFLTSNMKNYETIYKLDSNNISSGDYLVSFRYYYQEKTHQAMDCHFIVNEVSAVKGDWIIYTPIKAFSAFYNGYAVFEQKLKIDRKKHYDFMLNGNEERSYKISHFLLRPKNTTVVVINKKDSTFNNFPEN